jgi:hypothetical protein
MSGKSIWDKYQLMVYVCLVFFAIILGGVGHYLPEGTVQSILINLCSELFAVAVLFFLFEREKTKRACEEIFIVLKENAKNEFIYPVPLRRSNFSRQEVLGIIGMIPMKGARESEDGKKKKIFFNIEYVSNDPEFLSSINNISEGEGDTIYIRCTAEELKQFDFPAAWKRQAV